MPTRVRRRFPPPLPSLHTRRSLTRLHGFVRFPIRPSKAPVWGVLLTHGFRAHTVTLTDTVTWMYEACDDKGFFEDMWCFNMETIQLPHPHPEMKGDLPPYCRAHSATSFWSQDRYNWRVRERLVLQQRVCLRHPDPALVAPDDRRSRHDGPTRRRYTKTISGCSVSEMSDRR
ncbi:hypothetical protein DFH94DRAFT_705581 [Russula ochroleuca]|uniref:Uncharacterized protein n=1 Tax=Russula ochroleuca TaxID=152965 RepID=A0A9P5N7I6_9AGAM|nr:hypothetical protein DFH94DRAFT_705581 [Russula ochroleuca]